MSCKTKKIESDLTQGAILPKVIAFVIPLILTGILNLLFHTADTIVVGRWGGSTPEECESALAAVGSCTALINLLINLFMGLSMGAGVCLAHDIGAGQAETAEKTVHTAFLISVCCGIVAGVIGMIATEPLLTMMGTGGDGADAEEVLRQAVLYMRAYFAGVPVMIVYNFCAAMYRSNGDTVRPLIFLTSAGILNIILNMIFVIVFHWGAMGVGVATAISDSVACVLIVLHMLRTEGICRLHPKEIFKKYDRSCLSRILFVGVPAGISSMLFSISNVLIQSSVNLFGKTIVAGNTAASNLEGYVYTAQNAVSNAAMTFVGQNVGAKKYDRVKKSILICSGAVIAVGAVMGVIVTLLGPQLLSLYVTDNPAVISAGMRRLPWICVPYFLCGLMEVGSSSVRGMGKSILPTMVSLVGSCLFRIVWIATVFAYCNALPDFAYALEVLYASYPISWFLTSAVHYVCIVCIYRKKTKLPEVPIPSSEKTVSPV